MDFKDLVERLKKNSPELFHITCYKCGKKRPFKHYKFEKAEGNHTCFEWICEPCLGTFEPVVRNLIKMQVVGCYDNGSNQGYDFTFDIDSCRSRFDWDCEHVQKQSATNINGGKCLQCYRCGAYCGFDYSE